MCIRDRRTHARHRSTLGVTLPAKNQDVKKPKLGSLIYHDGGYKNLRTAHLVMLASASLKSSTVVTPTTTCIAWDETPATKPKAVISTKKYEITLVTPATFSFPVSRRLCRPTKRQARSANSYQFF